MLSSMSHFICNRITAEQRSLLGSFLSTEERGIERRRGNPPLWYFAEHFSKLVLPNNPAG